MAHCSTRYVTRGEGLRILAEARYELKFTRTLEEARYAYKRACKYKSLCFSEYCGSRPCRECHIEKEYNEQLRTIAFAKQILNEINK